MKSFFCILFLSLFCTFSYGEENLKFDFFIGGTKLRGANIFQQEKYATTETVWTPHYILQDFLDLKKAGASAVGLSIPGLFDVETYELRSDFVRKLDQLLDYAKKAELKVILAIRTGPGRGEGDITQNGKNNRELFSSQKAQESFVQMWKFISSKYKDEENIVAYDFLIEPHDITLEFWRTFCEKIIKSIRTIDKKIPLIVSLLDWSSPYALKNWKPIDEPYLVYNIHQYSPFTYTHQNIPGGEIKTLDEVYRGIGNWVKKYRRPIIIGEFGVDNFVKNRKEFMSYQLNKIESLGLNHLLWVWGPEYDKTYTFNGFDFKDDPDLLGPITSNWAR